MTILGERNSIRDDDSAKLGYVASVLAHHRKHAQTPLAVALRMAEVAIALDQIKIYFRIDGKPIAFVSWALLGEDVERRIFRTKSMALHISEWNEGESLWIVNFASSPEWVPQILCDLRDGEFRKHARARYIRVKDNQVLIRELVRRSSASFFVRRTIPTLSGPSKLPGWGSTGRR